MGILGGDQAPEVAPTVCAVVVTREKEADAATCLRALLESETPLSRIILIDNGSRDGSIDRLARQFVDRRRVEILHNDENLGYAAAANLGVRRATGADFVLLINDDAELRPETLGALVDAMIARPEAGLAVPRIVLASDPAIVWRGPSRFSWLKVGARDPERGRPIRPMDGTARCVQLVTGCVLLARTETFERLGAFDERFFFYGEDADYCFRAGQAGVCILFVGGATALHHTAGVDPVPASAFSAFHMARSHVLLIRKHATGLRRIYALAVHVVAHTALLAIRLIRTGRSWMPLGGWLRGSLDGLTAGDLSRRSGSAESGAS